MKKYFPDSSHPDKRRLDNVLDAICYNPSFFSFLAHVKIGHFFEVSPAFTTITGFPAVEIEEKGVSFFVEQVPKEDTLRVMEAQAENLAQASKPGFDPSLANLVSAEFRLEKADKTSITLNMICMTMSYSASGEIELGLAGAFVVGKDACQNNKLYKEIESLFQQAKSLYRSVYPPLSFSPPSGGLLEIVFEKDPRHVLTAKEKDVLLRMAKGLSSKQIAFELCISENTVETHRKNMLLKFESTNTAELVKKTSKLYWLE